MTIGPSAAALLCALFVTPASAQNFLEGVVSINVTMTKKPASPASMASALATTAAGQPQASGSTPTL
ncbi:hypothetical protein AB7828_03420 [Tardiphaga sp. 215_C5_N2_1]|uniref:hypothetical protein n=1 Tax=Tardiphaga sp. 215_C5_N2_1 TaxID=3240774 RepID=UPI003F8A9231